MHYWYIITCFVICDLLWWNREQVGATSLSLSRGQQSRLFYPIQSLRGSFLEAVELPFNNWGLLWMNYYKRSHYWMHCMKTLCTLLLMMCLLSKVLSGSMHRVGPIFVMQYCMENEKHLPCGLFLVSPEQVTYLTCHKWMIGNTHYM